MPTLDTSFGWLFVALAALFALALFPRVAPYFYPTSPGFRVRLAAPLIFLCLAAACFSGLAFPSLVFIVALGGGQIGFSRWKKGKPRLAP